MDFRDTTSDDATDLVETSKDTYSVPAPDEADPEDVEQYNLEFAKSNGLAPDFSRRGTGDVDAEEAPYAKQDGSLARNTKHKADFPWLYDPSRGVRWDFDPVELRNLSQTNTWVGMLIQSITKEIAETPWTIVRADGRTETQKRLSTHPEERTPLEKAEGEELPDAQAEQVYDLLMRPNPDDTWQDMVEMWMADLLEVGSVATVKAFHESAYDGEDFVADPETVRPRALQPTAPEVFTKDYHGKTGLVEGYWQFDDHRSPGSGSVDGGSGGRHRGAGSPTFFDSNEMLWSDMTPRTNRRYGIPPTLLVEDFLQSLDFAIQQEQEYLSRGSIPSGAWVLEEWSREEVKELRQEMEENVSGKPHKSMMFAGKNGTVSYEPMSMNFQELEFTERMKWYAKVVSSAFQVPTAVVGLSPEKVNYNTFQGERENFESNTLGPYLQKIERAVTHELITPHWGGEYRFEFKPGMSESTRAMISERVRSEFNRNLRTRNEARREIGLSEVDDEQDGFKDDVVEDSGDGGPFDDMELSVSKDSDEARREFNEGVYDPFTNGHELGHTDDGENRIRCDRAGELFKSANDDGSCPECGRTVWTSDVDGGSGNPNHEVAKDEPLRETDEWYQFDVQPGMVEELTDEIAGDVQDLFDRVLSDDEVRQIIDRLATDDEATEKSLSSLSRRLRDLFADSDAVERVRNALREETAAAARATIEESLSEASEGDVETDVDVEAIEAQLAEREVTFADKFADELKDDILDTVGDGWANGRGTQEIADEIAEQADINSGWTGSERIARQELHVATGEARSEVAGELDKVEVWYTSEDHRVRPAHDEMHGSWKRPGEDWSVTYEDRGTRTESVPGDSRAGIGCRCTTLIRDRETVDQSDHAGV